VDTLQHLFASHGFNAFPVVDDADTLCGIVTKLDLLRVFGPDPDRLLPALNVLWAERVADIMRRRVITLAPDDLVATAVDRMLSMKLRSLPVVERRDGKAFVVGMVSRGDVINALVLQTNTPP
jgi:CBS domain-containing protein